MKCTATQSRVARMTLALVLLATTGCMTSGQAVEFNNKLAEANKQLFESGQTWGRALAPGLKGEAVDGATLKKGVEQASKVLDTVTKNMKALSIPGHETARQFYKAHQAFLAVEATLIDTDLPAIVETAVDTLTPPLARSIKLQKAMSDMMFEEQQALHVFRKAQNAFALANSMTIEDDPAQFASYVITSCKMGNQRLNLAGRSLGQSLAPAFAGQLLRAPEVKGQLEEFKKLVEEVRAVVSGSDFTGTGSVAGLVAAEKVFLDVEAEQIAAFSEIVKVGRNADLDPASRQKQIQALVKAMVDKEQQAIQKLQAAVQAVVNEFPALK